MLPPLGTRACVPHRAVAPLHSPRCGGGLVIEALIERGTTAPEHCRTKEKRARSVGEETQAT